MSDETKDPTQTEIDELETLMLPGSDFWKWDEAKQNKFMQAMKSRSEHPAVVAMQRELANLLKRAALSTPEVQLLIGVAHDCAGILESSGYGEFGTALRDAVKAVEEAAR